MVRAFEYDRLPLPPCVCCFRNRLIGAPAVVGHGLRILPRRPHGSSGFHRDSAGLPFVRRAARFRCYSAILLAVRRRTVGLDLIGYDLIAPAERCQSSLPRASRSRLRDPTAPEESGRHARSDRSRFNPCGRSVANLAGPDCRDHPVATPSAKTAAARRDRIDHDTIPCDRSCRSPRSRSSRSRSKSGRDGLAMTEERRVPFATSISPANIFPGHDHSFAVTAQC